MSNRCFIVLYTHQKTKKAKTWHDGILQLNDHAAKATLFDEKNSKLDTLFVKDVTLGEQLESDRYYILVEEEKKKAVLSDNSSSLKTSLSTAGGTSKPRFPAQNRGIRTGLKRKNTGFVPPRMVKQPKTISDVSNNTKNSISYDSPSHLERPPSDLSPSSLLGLYSRSKGLLEQGNNQKDLSPSKLSSFTDSPNRNFISSPSSPWTLVGKKSPTVAGNSPQMSVLSKNTFPNAIHKDTNAQNNFCGSSSFQQNQECLKKDEILVSSNTKSSDKAKRSTADIIALLKGKCKTPESINEKSCAESASKVKVDAENYISGLLSYKSQATLCDSPSVMDPAACEERGMAGTSVLTGNNTEKSKSFCSIRSHEVLSEKMTEKSTEFCINTEPSFQGSADNLLEKDRNMCDSTFADSMEDEGEIINPIHNVSEKGKENSSYKEIEDTERIHTERNEAVRMAANNLVENDIKMCDSTCVSSTEGEAEVINTTNHVLQEEQEDSDKEIEETERTHIEKTEAARMIAAGDTEEETNISFNINFSPLSNVSVSDNSCDEDTIGEVQCDDLIKTMAESFDSASVSIKTSKGTADTPASFAIDQSINSVASNHSLLSPAEINRIEYTDDIDLVSGSIESKMKVQEETCQSRTKNYPYLHVQSVPSSIAEEDSFHYDTSQIGSDSPISRDLSHSQLFFTDLNCKDKSFRYNSQSSLDSQSVPGCHLKKLELSPDSFKLSVSSQESTMSLKVPELKTCIPEISECDSKLRSSKSSNHVNDVQSMFSSHRPDMFFTSNFNKDVCAHTEIFSAVSDDEVTEVKTGISSTTKLEDKIFSSNNRTRTLENSTNSISDELFLKYNHHSSEQREISTSSSYKVRDSTQQFTKQNDNKDSSLNSDNLKENFILTESDPYPTQNSVMTTNNKESVMHENSFQDFDMSEVNESYEDCSKPNGKVECVSKENVQDEQDTFTDDDGFKSVALNQKGIPVGVNEVMGIDASQSNSRIDKRSADINSDASDQLYEQTRNFSEVLCNDLPHPDFLTKKGMMSKSKNQVSSEMYNALQQSADKLSSYKVKGSITSDVVRRNPGFSHSVTSDEELKDNIMMCKVVRTEKTQPDKVYNKFQFNPEDGHSPDLNTTEERSFYIDVNNGKPKFVERPSEFENSPVQNSPQDFISEDVDWNFEIPSLKKFLKPDKNFVKHYSDPHSLASNCAVPIKKFSRSELLHERQKSKKPLKTKPFDDILTHTSYSNCHISPTMKVSQSTNIPKPMEHLSPAEPKEGCLEIDCKNLSSNTATCYKMENFKQKHQEQKLTPFLQNNDRGINVNESIGSLDLSFSPPDYGTFIKNQNKSSFNAKTSKDINNSASLDRKQNKTILLTNESYSSQTTSQLQTISLHGNQPDLLDTFPKDFSSELMEDDCSKNHTSKPNNIFSQWDRFCSQDSQSSEGELQNSVSFNIENVNKFSASGIFADVTDSKISSGGIELHTFQNSQKRDNLLQFKQQNYRRGAITTERSNKVTHFNNHSIGVTSCDSAEIQDNDCDILFDNSFNDVTLREAPKYNKCTVISDNLSSDSLDSLKNEEIVAGTTGQKVMKSTNGSRTVGKFSNLVPENLRNISGELQFSCKNEVMNNEIPTRQIKIPATFPDVFAYRQVLISALKEHLNIQMFELSKIYHGALSKVDTSSYIPLNPGKNERHEKGKSSVANNNPDCKCKLPSKMVQVKKEGPNKGRFFYACSAPRNQQCKFFQWADQMDKSNKKTSNIHRTTGYNMALSNAESITTYLRGQNIYFYCECRFIRKVPDFKRFKKWSREIENTKKRLFIKLSKKDASSLFSKDDLWIISADLNFDKVNTFLAKSIYFGPSTNNEVEIEPITGFSSSNWYHEASCHAILACNASTELGCITNLQENITQLQVPILPSLLCRGVADTYARRDARKFVAPSRTQGSGNLHVPEFIVAENVSLIADENFVNFISFDRAPIELVVHHGFPVRTQRSEEILLYWGKLAPKYHPNDLCEEYIQTYHLNSDQTAAIRRVAGIMNKEQPSADPIVLIHGVFGAGKSYLLAVIIMFLVRVFDENDIHTPGLPYEWKLLVSSTTNVAVDRILTCLLDLEFEEFVRVGSVKKIAKLVLPYSVHATGTDNQELLDLQAMLRSDLTPAEKQYVRKSIEKHRLGENRKKLGKVRVVGVTCAASVFSCLQNMKFPVVVIDECSQMTEPASLLPIARFSCQKLVLVGDPKQLDPTIQGSEAAHGEGLEQTMFDRFKKMGYKATMLRTQYRCHPLISAIPNTLFYDGQLINGVKEEDRMPLTDCIPTLCFYDVSRGKEASDGSNSYYNEQEAKFVVFLIEVLILSGIDPISIGVMTLYKSQLFKIITLLHNSKATKNKEIKSIQVSTVDAFQGGEREVMILSCVRTDYVGFIDSDKRTNVALSRAKNHLLIIGNHRNLSKNALWSKVIKHCRDSKNGIKDADETVKELEDMIAEGNESNRTQEEKVDKSVISIDSQHSSHSLPMSLSDSEDFGVKHKNKVSEPLQENRELQNCNVIEDIPQDKVILIDDVPKKPKGKTGRKIDVSVWKVNIDIENSDEDLPEFGL